MARSYYLPEYHDFEHVATAPLPIIINDGQWDWVNSTDCMEQWLCRYVGNHHSTWAYHTGTNLDYRQVCVAFKWAKHKTLFLLQWS
jgi:hypothetical protein